MARFDELIEYGQNHEDDKVKELADAFKEYRNVVFKYTMNGRYGKHVPNEE